MTRTAKRKKGEEDRNKEGRERGTEGGREGAEEETGRENGERENIVGSGREIKKILEKLEEEKEYDQHTLYIKIIKRQT